MVQAIIYTDDKEDKIVIKYSDLWDISKAETVKKMIREYDKLIKEVKKNGISN